MNRIGAVALAALLASLTACSAPTYDTYEDAAWAGAICTDGGWTRVPDHYCPIGDGAVDGQQFYWRYRPYRDTDHDIDVVYVGYPVDRATWTDRRPARVSTLHIDRGSYPERPAFGQPSTSTARIATAPERSRVKTRVEQDMAKGIQRGGLGDKTTTRAAVPVVDTKPVTRKAPPPPPAGKRAMAAAKTTTKASKK